MPYKKIGIAAFIFLAFCSQAMSADITTLQAALEAARQNMENAKSQYDEARDERTNQERTVQRLQAELDKAQKKLAIDRTRAKAASRHYFAAKERHDRAQAILDKAWGSK